ncbi:MAG: response regulator [Gammaproteobacteria bacterium]|nr:response regulator [Gammaproteobacteria bacterium]
MIDSKDEHHAPRRILVVEDRLLIAEAIADMLEDVGLAVVGPVANLEAAMALARDEHIDAALLDVNLNDIQTCFPVAELLSERGVPIAFLTGYDSDNLFPAPYRSAPRLVKPFQAATLLEVVRKLLAA